MTPDRRNVTLGDRDLAWTAAVAHLALALAGSALSGRLLATAFGVALRYVSAERLLQIAPWIATLADEGALAVALLLGVAAVALVGAGRAFWNVRFRRRWRIAAACNLVNPLIAPLVVVGLVLTYIADAGVADSEAAGDGADAAG